MGHSEVVWSSSVRFGRCASSDKSVVVHHAKLRISDRDDNAARTRRSSVRRSGVTSSSDVGEIVAGESAPANTVQH